MREHLCSDSVSMDNLTVIVEDGGTLESLTKRLREHLDGLDGKKPTIEAPVELVVIFCWNGNDAINGHTWDVLPVNLSLIHI